MDLVWRNPCRLGRVGVADQAPAAVAPTGDAKLRRYRAGEIGKMTMIRRLILVATLLMALAGPSAYGVEPSERLADPVLETRARALSEKLRCLVCQNQSIDESNADLAHDLRVLLRKRLLAGDTDQQALDYIVARYGVFVLFDPPFEPTTYMLWLTPPLLVLFIGALLIIRARRRTDRELAPLTEEERARAAALLSEPR